MGISGRILFTDKMNREHVLISQQFLFPFHFYYFLWVRNDSNLESFFDPTDEIMQQEIRPLLAVDIMEQLHRQFAILPGKNCMSHICVFWQLLYVMIEA